MLVGQAPGQHGQLPQETDEFVGREAELEVIAELLGEARLLTLVGPGGVGKTRVAVRAATAAAAHYASGVCFIELSALRDPALLPNTVAGRLGLPEQSPGSQFDAVLAQLADRQLLLILDTCEHLLDACAELAAAIVAAAPRVVVLATSRAPLDAAGEVTFSIPPLPVPWSQRTGAEAAGPFGPPAPSPSPWRKHRPDDGQPGPDSSQGPEGGDAVALFERRAAAASPGFTVTDANRADVVKICCGLDGIPLAIELAAGKLRDLTVAELSSRIGDRLALLTGGTGGTPRHATARNAIAWSYDVCTPRERTLWARLSVFPGSFDVNAAAAVCASDDLDPIEIFESIIRLSDKSVLIRADADGDDQPVRFRMLDTLREFGAEQLAASGEEDAICGRFIASFLRKARYFDEHLTDPEQLDRFREMRREHSNIRAALTYALDEAKDERRGDGVALATTLYGYWHMSGLLAEGGYWLAKVLDLLGPAPTLERGWALADRGYLGAMQGTADEAVADAQAGTQIGLDLGHEPLIGRGYNYLTLALAMAERYPEAYAAAAAAEPVLEKLADVTGLAILDDHLAHLSHLAGDPEGAVRYAERALGRFGGAKEWWASAWAYVISAMALYQLPSRDAETTRTINRGLLAKHELGDMIGVAYCLEIHAWLAARAGRPIRAAWLLGAADPLWKQAGGRLGGAPALELVHEAALAAGQAALGADRCTVLLEAGALAHTDGMVALALSDAEAPGDQVPSIPEPARVTDREWEIASLAVVGLSAEQIARHLFISADEVSAHLTSLYAKLGVSSAPRLAPWLDEQQARLAKPPPARP
jgi:predicted ATPase/DNA-binding CsgD family transcriptional regulator